MRQGTGAAVVVGALVLLQACSAGPPVTYYTLNGYPAENPGPSAGVGSRRIAVRPFRVEPPYDQSRIVYRTTPDSPRVDFYAYHQWAAPLELEVAAAVVDGLAGRLPEHVVELYAVGRAYEAVVAGRLLRLEEVDRPNQIETRALLELELRSPAGEVLWVERAQGAAVNSGPTASVDEVVRLMAEALTGAVAEVAPGLVAALPAAPSASPDN